MAVEEGRVVNPRPLLLAREVIASGVVDWRGGSDARVIGDIDLIQHVGSGAAAAAIAAVLMGWVLVERAIVSLDRRARWADHQANARRQ